MPLSYTATLTANPTNGVFTFILDSHSSIVYAAFSIVLLSSCNSGIIYLQRFCIYTLIQLIRPLLSTAHLELSQRTLKHLVS
jgi:hypothetical protein